VSDAKSTVTLETAGTTLDKPRTVVLSVRLLWVNIALGALYSLWVPVVTGSTNDTPMLLFGLVVGVPVVMTLTILLSRGYGWVRLVWMTLWLFHLLFGEEIVKTWIADPWVWGIYGAAHEIIIVAALALSYSPTSRVWFRDMRSARRSRL
jgi:hypothetical protein